MSSSGSDRANDEYSFHVVILIVKFFLFLYYSLYLLFIYIIWIPNLLLLINS